MNRHQYLSLRIILTERGKSQDVLDLLAEAYRTPNESPDTPTRELSSVDTSVEKEVR